jgi:hypothetical protein
MQEGESFDGMSIVLGYLKVLDDMVELYITQDYRKFVKQL